MNLFDKFLKGSRTQFDATKALLALICGVGKKERKPPPPKRVQPTEVSMFYVKRAQARRQRRNEKRLRDAIRGGYVLSIPFVNPTDKIA